MHSCKTLPPSTNIVGHISQFRSLSSSSFERSSSIGRQVAVSRNSDILVICNLALDIASLIYLSIMDYSYYPKPQAPYQFLGFAAEPNETQQNQQTNDFTSSASSVVSPAILPSLPRQSLTDDCRINILMLVFQLLTTASTMPTTSHQPISQITDTLYRKAQHLQSLLPALCDIMDAGAQLQSPMPAQTLASSNRPFFRSSLEMRLAMNI